MTRPVRFTGDIFRLQPRGGITRYFMEVIPRLPRRVEIMLGWIQSDEAAALGVPARAAFKLPAVRGVARLAAPVNAFLDWAWFARPSEAILHPTYYRDPARLPTSAPLVVTVHDMIHERFPELFPHDTAGPKGPERHKAALCRRADRVLCNSHATARDVVERLGIPVDRIRVIHHAGRDWSAIPERPVAGAERPFALWVGQREAHKNFAVALGAFAACPEARPLDLLCVGGGAYTGAERAAIESLGLLARARQRALADAELHWAYARAAVLLYPSLWEGFGLPPLEALGLGCPVVAADRGSLPEICGDAACYVDPTDLDSIAGGIARALSEGRGPGAVALRVAQAARFSWDRTAASVEAAYRELD